MWCFDLSARTNCLFHLSAAVWELQPLLPSIKFGSVGSHASQTMEVVVHVQGWICNSSICMTKRGLKPTGIAIYDAQQKGFASVAHYVQV